MRSKHLEAPGKGVFVYDYKYDLLYFRIDDREYDRSAEFGDLVADIDEEGFVTGTRIFGASKFFKLQKESLRNIVGGNFSSSVHKGAITIKLEFWCKMRNRTKAKTIAEEFVREAPSNLKESSVACPAIA